MEYFCIFDKGKPCPVKDAYKLKPENLIEWCKLCQSRKDSTVVQLAAKLVDLVDTMQKRQVERDALIMQTIGATVSELKNLFPKGTE